VERQLAGRVGLRRRGTALAEALSKLPAAIGAKASGLRAAKHVQEAVARLRHPPAKDGIVAHLAEQGEGQLRLPNVQGVLQGPEEREPLLQQEVCHPEVALLQSPPEVAPGDQALLTWHLQAALCGETLLQKHDRVVTVVGEKGARQGTVLVRVGRVEVSLSLDEAQRTDSRSP